MPRPKNMSKQEIRIDNTYDKIEVVTAWSDDRRYIDAAYKIAVKYNKGNYKYEKNLMKELERMFYASRYRIVDVVDYNLKTDAAKRFFAENCLRFNKEHYPKYPVHSEYESMLSQEIIMKYTN